MSGVQTHTPLLSVDVSAHEDGTRDKKKKKKDRKDKYGSRNKSKSNNPTERDQKVTVWSVADNLAPMEEDNVSSRPFGLAFSGGGIRAASIAAGVLEAITKHDADFQQHIDYVSCVSGGGFVGSSLVEWIAACRKENVPFDPKEYFDNFRRNCGYLVDANGWGSRASVFNRAVRFLLNTAMVFGAIFVAFLFSALCLVPCGFWAALLITRLGIDSIILEERFEALYVMFGGALVSSFIASTLKSLANDTGTPRRVDDAKEMLTRQRERAKSLIALSLAFKVASYFLSGFLTVLTVAYLAHTYIGSDITSESIQICFAVLLIFLRILLGQSMWMSIRGGVIVFLFLMSVWARIVQWKVYKSTVYSLAYTDDAWHVALGISLCLLLISPLLVTVKDRVLGTFYRWRLQLAFYRSPGLCGAGGLCGLPGGMTISENSQKPFYLGNVTASMWEVEAFQSEFDLMSIEHNKWQRTGNAATYAPHFTRNTQISKVMALSAAALATEMGTYEADLTSIRSAQILVGLSLGDFASLQPGSRLSWLSMYTVLSSFIIGSVFIADWCSDSWATILLAASECVFLAFWIGLPFLPNEIRCLRLRLSDYSVVRDYRSWLDMREVGQHPSVVYMSDGGCTENLGLVTLFQKRCATVVSVDAEFDAANGCPALFNAMQYAREKLGCSFFSLENSTDIFTDLVKFSHDPYRGVYVFRVVYPRLDANPPSLQRAHAHLPSRDNCEGLVWYIKSKRGAAEKMFGDDIDRLNGLCFDGCATPACGFTQMCLNRFPHHTTADQFFSRALYDAYHKYGFDLMNQEVNQVYEHYQRTQRKKNQINV